ncbi:MAG: signal peptidase I [Candidatus Hydrogenedentes bacterium]|nr:signal peptidase I [Candidatus Hydrogenedentota bacterium]
MVTSRKEIEALQDEAIEIHGKFRRVRNSLKKNPDNTELRKKKKEYRERLKELDRLVREAIEERRLAKEDAQRERAARKAAETKTQESSEPQRRHPHTLEERRAQLAERKRAPEPGMPLRSPSASSSRVIHSDHDEVQPPALDPDDSNWVLSDSQSLDPARFDVGESKYHKRIIVPPTNWLVITFIRVVTTIRLHPVRILVLLLLVVVLPVGGIMKFKLRIHEVTSKNAEPTLNVGDKVLVWAQMSYRPGDLVVVPDPYTPNRVLTRRVVAVAGDEIELRDRRLFVNNEEVYEPYVTKRAGFDFQFGPMKISTGKVYAISDNRRLAPDDTLSYMGISTDTIQGKILFRYFPRSSLGFLE